MEIEIITNFEKIHPQKILEMLGNKFYLTKRKIIKKDTLKLLF
jgi:hypothetical protein